MPKSCSYHLNLRNFTKFHIISPPFTKNLQYQINYFFIEGINHVKVFSQLARKLVNKNFRQSLFAANDADSILALLEAELTF
ncbi:PTS sugar transporter subunit IIA [Salmonella enterica subsp. enterica serovar Give]|nr:PTS sugar transporter subunit IIA [Salmonella enterica subsp. enterica serovar Give]